jgi:hypothetical protein
MLGGGGAGVGGGKIAHDRYKCIASVFSVQQLKAKFEAKLLTKQIGFA